MKTKLKRIPKFKTDEEFGEFWMTHDLTDYYDLTSATQRTQFIRVFGTKERIDIPLSDRLIREIQLRAKSEDVPVTVLLTKYLREGLAKRRRTA
jgi:predicted DNA binding CopG/RHH family protein